MTTSLTVFEQIESLSEKGIYVMYTIESTTSHVTYNVEARYEGELIFGVNTPYLAPGMQMVLNEIALHEIFEYAATENREGYIVAKDLNEASWKITVQQGIPAKDLIGVSKVTFVPNQLGLINENENESAIKP